MLLHAIRLPAFRFAMTVLVTIILVCNGDDRASRLYRRNLLLSLRSVPNATDWNRKASLTRIAIELKTQSYSIIRSDVALNTTDRCFIYYRPRL